MTAPTHLHPKAAEYFAPVLVWLDNGAPHVTDPRARFDDNYDGETLGFNMSYFQTPYEEDFSGNDCGTACCIAGALAAFNHEAFKDSEFGVSSVGYFIGMTDNEISRLFFAEIAHSNTIRDLESISPAEAAATIRGFLATGKVIWEGYDNGEQA